MTISGLKTRNSVFVYSSELEKYPYPPEHPFNVSRAQKVREIVSSMGLLSGNGISEVAPVAAERVVLKKFHTARYLHALKKAAAGHLDAEALKMGIGSPDCPVFKGLYEYAVLATGGTLAAAKMICGEAIPASRPAGISWRGRPGLASHRHPAGGKEQGQDALATKNEGKMPLPQVAFNPSGGYHHAGPELAAGFCYINDVALACIVLTEKGKRVLYLDVDVHHGDGVANAFYDRSDVLTISLHQNPKTLFPGTGFEDEIGTGAGKGYCVNVPLPVGTYDQAYMKAFEAIVLPLMKAYNPDVIVFELGADALAGDPLANLSLTNNTYAEIINHLMNFGKPILATGGGGYNVENTVRAWALAWSIFCGADPGQDIHHAVGGVLLESTEWQGGLRDRELPVTEQQKNAVEPAIETVVRKIKKTIFPIHGI